MDLQGLTPSNMSVYLKVAIENSDVRVCFACIALACNSNVLKSNRIVTFLVNAIEDTFGHIKDSGKFIDNVLDRARLYHGPDGWYLDEELKDARIQKSGHAYVYLRRHARKKWSLILGLCLLRSIWRHWIAFRLRPDGPFIKKKALEWR